MRLLVESTSSARFFVKVFLGVERMFCFVDSAYVRVQWVIGLTSGIPKECKIYCLFDGILMKANK